MTAKAPAVPKKEEELRTFIIFCILTSWLFLSIGWSRSPIQGTGFLQLLPHHIIPIWSWYILIYDHHPLFILIFYHLTSSSTLGESQSLSQGLFHPGFQSLPLLIPHYCILIIATTWTQHVQVMDEHLIQALLNWASSQIKTKWWWVEANNWVDNNTLITTAVRRPARLETNTEQTENTWGNETKYRINQKYLG